MPDTQRENSIEPRYEQDAGLNALLPAAAATAATAAVAAPPPLLPLLLLTALTTLNPLELVVLLTELVLTLPLAAPPEVSGGLEDVEAALSAGEVGVVIATLEFVLVIEGLALALSAGLELPLVLALALVLVAALDAAVDAQTML